MSGMRTVPKDVGADAQSRDTGFSGLPKSCLLVCDVTSLGAFAADTQLAFDKVAYNYGGFGFNFNGALYTSIIVPETGVYRCGMQVATLANTQTTRSGLRQNGNIVWRDGVFRMNGNGTNHATGGTVSEQTWGEGEFKQGDVLDGFLGNPFGAPFNTTVGGVWLCMTKLGGRY